MPSRRPRRLSLALTGLEPRFLTAAIARPPAAISVLSVPDSLPAGGMRGQYQVADQWVSLRAGANFEGLGSFNVAGALAIGRQGLTQGILLLSNRSGSFTLRLSDFQELPNGRNGVQAQYVVARGAGAYAGLQGAGTILLIPTEATEDRGRFVGVVIPNA